MRRFAALFVIWVLALLVLGAQPPTQGGVVIRNRLDPDNPQVTQPVTPPVQTVGATGVLKGCSTIYFIDEDCDGYGVAVRSSGVYGWDSPGLGDMPDADDSDPNINTTASVVAAYGSGGTLSNAQLLTFLKTKRGYTNLAHIVYISKTGNDTTGTVDNPSLPFQHYGNGGYGAYASIGADYAVVWRAGTYTNADMGAAGQIGDGGYGAHFKGGSLDHPVVMINYPGEVVKFQTTTTIINTAGGNYSVLDGLIVEEPDNNPGGQTAYGFSMYDADYFTARNIECNRVNYCNNVDGKGSAHVTIEHSVFHHNYHYGLYPGSNPYNGNSVPSYWTLQDNIFYADGYEATSTPHTVHNNYGGFQFNGRCTSCVIQRNVIHSSASSGFTLDSGFSNNLIANNLLFNNYGHGIVIQEYDLSSCAVTGTGTSYICPYPTHNNLFINNTIWVSDKAADGAPNTGYSGIAIVDNLNDPGGQCVVGGVAVPGVNCVMEQTFRNNIIINTSGGPAFWMAGKTLPGNGWTDTWTRASTIQNNILYGPGTTFVREFVTTYSQQQDYNYSYFESNFATSTDINSDPKFVHVVASEYGTPERFDFRLARTSPARAAGNATGAPTQDIRTLTRSGTPDIGAYMVPGPPQVTWTPKATPLPGWNGYLSLHYDPTSRRVLHYGVVAVSTSIYSTDMFAYTTSADSWTRLGGTQSLGQNCDTGASSDVQPWPHDRHPYLQMAVDTSRHRLWLMNGVCQGINPDDFWYYSLQVNPTANRWTSVGGAVTGAQDDALVWSSDDDVLILIGQQGSSGHHKTWVYCPSTGPLTAPQTAAGCSAANAWTHLVPLDDIPPPGSPSYWNFENSFYDPILHKLYAFHSGYYGLKAIWTYTPSTQTWANTNVTGLPSETSVGSFAEQNIAAITSGPWIGGYVYHRTAHNPSGDTTSMDYFYDPGTNSLTLLTANAGPKYQAYQVWDAYAQRLVAWSYAGELWQGSLQ